MGKEKSQINLQYDRQLENQQQQNDWQSVENQIDAQRQQQMWMEQFARQVEQQNSMFEKEGERWQQQFDIQNKYNSPEAQVARLTSAGINPAALASSLSAGSSSASVGGSSGASAPSPSGISGHGVTPIGLNSPNGLSSDAALFSSAAQLADSIGKLGKYGVESSAIQRKVGAEVENIMSDTQMKRSTKHSIDLNNALTETFGKDKIGAEIQKLYADSYSAQTQGDLNKANELLSLAQEKLANVETKYKHDSYYACLALLNAQKEELDSRIKLHSAQSTEAYASAEKSRSEASYTDALRETEDMLRSGKFTNQQLVNQITRFEKEMKNRANVIDKSTMAQQYESVVHGLAQNKIIDYKLREELIQAIQKKDYNRLDKFFNYLGTMLGGSSDVVTAAGFSKFLAK